MSIFLPVPTPQWPPVPAPQQPRQFFTPGLALGVPKPKQPESAQRAAYQRDRVEIAHLIQRTLPRITAAQPLGAPGPRTWAQQAAYERDRIELAPLFQPVPLATAALPLAAPIAYRSPQQAAYQQPRFHDRSMAIEIGETVIDFTAGFALGAPPPLPFDQFAALRRDALQPQQLRPFLAPQPAPGVPFLATQSPARVHGDDPAVLDEVLPGPFTMVRPAPVTFQRLQLFAQARGDDPAILHQALQAFFVPPAVLTVTRLEFAIAGEAARFSLELERRMFTLPDDGRVH